jgi:hypothetical protein
MPERQTSRLFAGVQRRSRLAGLASAAAVGLAWVVCSVGAAEPGGGRLMADWPARLTAAGCPPIKGHPGERRCRDRDSFAVCKEAVESGHLLRCRLAGSAEVFPVDGAGSAPSAR